jgi:hypothetical protein
MAESSPTASPPGVASRRGKVTRFDTATNRLTGNRGQDRMKAGESGALIHCTQSLLDVNQ